MPLQRLDVVRLKPGGPRMICEKYIDDPTYFFGGETGWLCRWISQGAARQDCFEEDLLVLVPPDDPPAEKVK
jgi:uncharacterized protein YodC (DUF2158 family)